MTTTAAFGAIRVPKLPCSQSRQDDRLGAQLGRAMGGIGEDLSRFVVTIEQLNDALLAELGAAHACAPLVRAMSDVIAETAPLVRLVNSCSTRQSARQLTDANRMLSGLRPHLQRLLPAKARLNLSTQPGAACGWFDAGGIEQTLLHLQMVMRPRLTSSSRVSIRTRTEAGTARRKWVAKLTFAGAAPRRRLPGAWPELVLIARQAGGELVLCRPRTESEPRFALKIPLLETHEQLRRLRALVRKLFVTNHSLRAAAVEAGRLRRTSTGLQPPAIVPINAFKPINPS